MRKRELLLLMPLILSSLIPPGWLGLVHSLQFRAYLLLGYWPRYGRPDPKDLPEDFAVGHFVLIWQTSEIAFYSLIITICIGTLFLFAQSVPIPIRAFPLAISVLTVIVFIIDPVDALDWYYD